jgi:xanthine dehydrogenase accessory factor
VRELPLEAVDPVCGMTVAVVADPPTAEHEGVADWFCCPGCRGRFTRDPARYLTTEPTPRG